MTALIVQKAETPEVRDIDDTELDLVGGGACTAYTTVYTARTTKPNQPPSGSNEWVADSLTCDSAQA